jgi:hypothetical protein
LERFLGLVQVTLDSELREETVIEIRQDQSGKNRADNEGSMGEAKRTLEIGH